MTKKRKLAEDVLSDSLLETEDYFAIGTMVRQTARASGGGCFAILEGGYNHDVLGHNVAALIDGLSS